jgi:hypothetical protein
VEVGKPLFDGGKDQICKTLIHKLFLDTSIVIINLNMILLFDKNFLLLIIYNKKVVCMSR